MVAALSDESMSSLLSLRVRAQLHVEAELLASGRGDAEERYG
jgi:hypothetical protein